MSDIKKVMKMRASAQCAEMTLADVLKDISRKSKVGKKALEALEDVFEDLADVLWDIRELELKNEHGKVPSDLKKHEEYALEAELYNQELGHLADKRGERVAKRRRELIKDLTRALGKRDYYGAKAGVIVPEAEAPPAG